MALWSRRRATTHRHPETPRNHGERYAEGPAVERQAQAVLRVTASSGLPVQALLHFLSFPSSSPAGRLRIPLSGRLIE